MMHCEAFVGKVVRKFSLFEDGPYGPEINIEFTDGTGFNACLKTSHALEAKLLRNTADGTEVIQDLSTHTAP